MKDRKKDKSTAFLIHIIAAATVLAGVAMFMYTAKNKKEITLQNQTYLADATKRMANKLDSEIDDGFDGIRIVAKLLSAGRTNNEIDVKQLREILEHSEFDFIEFADTEGWDHTITGEKTFAGDRKYYLDGVLNGNTGMELIYNSRATHETLVMFYSPVYCGSQIIGAVIGVYQAANKITKLLQDEYFGEKGLAYLASEEGRIIASSEWYDPSAETYICSLKPGGSLEKLNSCGWQLIQYFPQKATDAMVHSANRFGYLLTLSIFLLLSIVMAAVTIFLRKKHSAHKKEMEEALYQAESANRAKTTFLNNMSHDIRTPLNAITGFNRLAMKEVGKDEEKVKDYLQKVARSSDSLLTIINDILEISRIESGRISLSDNRDDILHSFDGIDSILLEMASNANVDLSFEYGNIRDRYITCDVVQVNRILTNLISNAIKYTPAGGWIKVRCEQEGRDSEGRGLYRYSVKDNGIGITEEFKKNLFKPFSREQSSTVSKIQGTGLGLAMCKDLAELMGGTISCESKQGEGSLFTVVLPFKLRNIQEHDVTETKAEDQKDISFKGKKILLVDDNELNREIATAILEEYGLLITAADDGDVAAEIIGNAKSGDFDLILMDIQMPRVDGFEATRRIRALGTEISRIPIVAMTANAFEEDRKAALEAGMDGHLAKPIDTDKLTGTLARFLA